MSPTLENEHVPSVSTSGIHERRKGEAALLAKDKVGQIHQGKNVNTHLAECSHTRWVGQPQSDQKTRELQSNPRKTTFKVMNVGKIWKITSIIAL